jgi:hypothetical protein
MKTIGNLLIGLELFALPFVLPAQLLNQTAGQAAPDSIVQLTAEARGLAAVAPENLPPFGTFWVVGRNGFAAPYPCPPSDDFPIYQMADSQYLVDGTDGQVSLNPRQTNATVEAALETQAATVVALIEQAQAATQVQRAGAMSLSGPLPPGGSTNGGGGVIFNAQTQVFTTNDLWLQFVRQSNTVSSLVIHTPWNTAGSNFMFDVFATTNLLPNVPGLNGTNWMLVTRSAPGQTNLSVSPLPGAPVCFFRLGTLQDSDNDGLTDAYEKLVSHTRPDQWDTDGDGIGDGDEISPGGLPWRLEEVRRSAVVIYANSPTTTQGGACGQCTVYLPAPAPAGGVTVQYYLGGSAVLNGDYTISPAAGQLTIAAGYSSGTISVCANGSGSYSPIGLYADLTLTNATGYLVDSTPAEVKIVDNGLPGIQVSALPPWVRRPNATYGTNTAGFYFVRGGPSTNALTINLSSAGSTAVAGPDYTALPTSIIFPANVRTNWLPITITPNSTNTADKNLVLTITSAPGYHLAAPDNTASVTIAATASPVLPVVQVAATDLDVTPASPGQFTFTRSLATTNALRVYYHVWGETNTVIASTNGQDTTFYSGLNGYADIPAGATSVAVSVTTTHPLAVSEPLTLTLAAGEYAIGTSNSATVYVDGTGTFSLVHAVTRAGIYGASVSQAAEITLTRLGSALSPLTVNWLITNEYLGPVIQGTRSGTFTWAARQSTIKVAIGTLWSSYSDSRVLPTLKFPSYTGFNFTVPYNPPSALFTVSVSGSPTLTVGEGATGYITVGHPHPNGVATSASLTVAGSATNGTDYALSTTVNFTASQTSVSLPFSAFSNASADGWKTVVVSMDSSGNSAKIGQAGLDRVFVRIQDPQNAVSDSDLDGDGLPDGYELANLASGYDPTVPNNPYVDADHDGLGLIEELELGSNPAVADAPPVYPSIDPADYVPLTLRVGAIGKMLAPGRNCALCHEVTVRAGNFIRTSSKTDWGHNPAVQDYLIQFLRGTNYPVQVTCNPLYQSLLTSNQAAAVNLAQPTSWPHYTAAYIAQFLMGTNGTYPFIVDTNKLPLLGTNLSLVQEVLPKRATLYIPDLTIAADVNRDGVIDFKNRADRTEATNPFTFWINDDSDFGSDDTAADLDPASNPINSANSAPDGLRDLEDFTRLQFKIDGLPGQFLTNYQVKVYLTNLVGTPSLRLFPAADATGSLGYLTNTTTATTQMTKSMLGVVTNGAPLAIATGYWQPAGANNFFLPLIFEGVSTGSCVVTFGFSTNNGPPVALSRPFYLNLQKVTGLYEHWTVGDTTNMDWHNISAYPARTADSAVFGKPQTASEQDYIVLVHGWRMQPWERRAFAGEAFKRMWHLGYKGRFVLYSWPTDYTDTTFWSMFDPLHPLIAQANRQNYDRSEQRAWRAGAGLYELLADLNEIDPPLKLRVLAHSMGNIVASEGLRLAGKEFNTPLVQSYIASQAASVANAYDAVNPEMRTRTVPPFFYTTPEIYAHFPRSSTNSQPYFAGMKKAVQSNNIVNFNNLDDYALSSAFAWPGNQDTKPDNNWQCQLVATNSVNTNTGYTYWDTNNNQLILNGREAYRGQVHEIFAYIAQAESRALGCAEDSTHHIKGEIGSSVNLNNPPFNFGSKDYEHSAEFNSINMNRRTYWWQVLSTFSLTNNLPPL